MGAPRKHDPSKAGTEFTAHLFTPVCSRWQVKWASDENAENHSWTLDGACRTLEDQEVSDPSGPTGKPSSKTRPSALQVRHEGRGRGGPAAGELLGEGAQGRGREHDRHRAEEGALSRTR